MLVHIQCINYLKKEYTVAINPEHVVAVTDFNLEKQIAKDEFGDITIYWKSLVLMTNDVEYRSTESYLDLVARLNNSE